MQQSEGFELNLRDKDDRSLISIVASLRKLKLKLHDDSLRVCVRLTIWHPSFGAKYLVTQTARHHVADLLAKHRHAMERLAEKNHYAQSSD